MYHGNNNVKQLAAKWYKKLDIPTEYDEKFCKLLEEVDGFSEMKFSDFDLEANKTEDRKNAVWALYFCEEVSHRYEEKGIPEDIMIDTLKDISIRIIWYTDRTGVMGIEGFTSWLFLHLRFENFKVGRLQFQIRASSIECEEYGLKQGDPVLAVHIPKGPKLTPESALDSFKRGEEFFMKYFPEYDFKCFTCYSWLLDNNLEKLLPPESNILKFRALFHVVTYGESYDCFKFGFPYGMTREKLDNFVPTTSLQARIKEHILEGGIMNMGGGLRERSQR